MITNFSYVPLFVTLSTMSFNKETILVKRSYFKFSPQSLQTLTCACNCSLCYVLKLRCYPPCVGHVTCYDEKKTNMLHTPVSCHFYDCTAWKGQSSRSPVLTPTALSALPSVSHCVDSTRPQNSSPYTLFVHTPSSYLHTRCYFSVVFMFWVLASCLLLET